MTSLKEKKDDSGRCWLVKAQVQAVRFWLPDGRRKQPSEPTRTNDVGLSNAQRPAFCCTTLERDGVLDLEPSVFCVFTRIELIKPVCCIAATLLCVIARQSCISFFGFGY